MPSHFHKKFRWGTVFATRHMSFIEPGTGLRMKRTNHRIRVPIDLYPCHIEEKMIMKKVRGESFMEWKTMVTTKEGTIIKFPGEFHRIKLAIEEEVKENEELKEFRKRWNIIIPQIVTQVTANVNNGDGGNGNGRNNGCSYKTFTSCNPKEFDGKGVQERGREAAIGMSWNDFRALLIEEFCPSNEMEKLENEF
ncbi:hypothetical protein Tco_0252597 [Tanacetum coccineum]